MNETIGIYCESFKFIVRDFMIAQLNLKGDELLVYSFIFNVCNEKRTGYVGSIEFLADHTSCSKKSVSACLRTLERKRLIRRELVGAGKTCAYRYLINYLTLIEHGVICKDGFRS